MILEMKTATITEKGQISIPKGLRKKKGFKTGSKVVVLALKDRLEIMPIEEFEKIECYLMSEKSLGRAWNRKEEDEAWKDL